MVPHLPNPLYSLLLPQQACEMVMDLLRERDQANFGDRNEYGSRGGGGGIDVSSGHYWTDSGPCEEFRELTSSVMQVPVPRHSVGVVIGRNGEMIKKIQNDAGVRIQFKQGEDEICNVYGTALDVMLAPDPMSEGVTHSYKFLQMMELVLIRSHTLWAPQIGVITQPG